MAGPGRNVRYQRTAAICGTVSAGKGPRRAVFGPWGRAKELSGPSTAGKAVAALYGDLRRQDAAGGVASLPAMSREALAALAFPPPGLVRHDAGCDLAGARLDGLPGATRPGALRCWRMVSVSRRGEAVGASRRRLADGSPSGPVLDAGGRDPVQCQRSGRTGGIASRTDDGGGGSPEPSSSVLSPFLSSGESLGESGGIRESQAWQGIEPPERDSKNCRAGQQELPSGTARIAERDSKNCRSAGRPIVRLGFPPDGARPKNAHAAARLFQIDCVVMVQELKRAACSRSILSIRPVEADCGG